MKKLFPRWSFQRQTFPAGNQTFLGLDKVAKNIQISTELPVKAAVYLHTQPCIPPGGDKDISFKGGKISWQNILLQMLVLSKQEWTTSGDGDWAP